MNHMTTSCCIHWRGGGSQCNLPWFWVRTCGWSPRTPPHSYPWRSEKQTIQILTLAKIVPIHILFVTFYLFIYFLRKKYPIESIIDILLKWKWNPFLYLIAWKVYPITAARLYIPLSFIMEDYHPKGGGGVGIIFSFFFHSSPFGFLSCVCTCPELGPNWSIKYFLSCILFRDISVKRSQQMLDNLV